jgi:predicted secreted protein
MICAASISSRPITRLSPNRRAQHAALADGHRHAHDRIVARLTVHLGQHHIRLMLGEEAAALDRRQLRRIAQHQHRNAERQQVVAQFLIDHRAFVDDHQLGVLHIRARLSTKVGSSSPWISRER